MRTGRSPERLVKSADRVRDLGEVFTSVATVEAMLDLLPSEMWQPHPSAMFLEPACGDGNFLVAILQRKLANIAREYDAGRLAGGPVPAAAQFHALQALASIYAVDIAAENIVGGTRGHEVGARDRLIAALRNWHESALGVRLRERSAVLACSRWIVDRNVLVGSMMDTKFNGTVTPHHDLPLVEYDWRPIDLTVSVSVTTMGAAMSERRAETSGAISLFDDPHPPVVWRGQAVDLRKAPVSRMSEVPARNRTGLQKT